jgi:hypothetical protein
MDFFDEIWHTLQDAKFYRNKNKMLQYRALIHTVIDLLEKDISGEAQQKQPRKLTFLKDQGKG